MMVHVESKWKYWIVSNGKRLVRGENLPLFTIISKSRIMKKRIIFFIICFTYNAGILNFCYGQEQNDYIKNNYYQTIYEAILAYRTGKKDVAYAKMKKAEEKNSLIQQIQYFETYYYVELLIDNNEYAKAKKYIKILAKDYGFSLEHLSKIKNFEKLKAEKDWNILEKSIQLSYDQFYTKDRIKLIEDLKKMSADDQKVRAGLIYPLNEKEKEAMRKTDSINFQKLSKITNEYGFPANLKIVGRENSHFIPNIETIYIHFSGYSGIKEVIFSMIQKGECSPYLLAAIVDRDCLINKKPHVYKIYKNIDLNYVIDPENLDNRRLEIGMPTIEMDRQLRIHQ